MDQYFKNSDGIPAILVFESDNTTIEASNIIELSTLIKKAKISGMKDVLQLSTLTSQCLNDFLSLDQTAAFLPITFKSKSSINGIRNGFNQIYSLVQENTDLTLYSTRPAGIAVDKADLFSKTDLSLMLLVIAII